MSGASNPIRDAEIALDEYRDRPTAYGRHAVEQARAELDAVRQREAGGPDVTIWALVRRMFGFHPA